MYFFLKWKVKRHNISYLFYENPHVFQEWFSQYPNRILNICKIVLKHIFQENPNVVFQQEWCASLLKARSSILSRQLECSIVFREAKSEVHDITTFLYCQKVNGEFLLQLRIKRPSSST